PAIGTARATRPGGAPGAVAWGAPGPPGTPPVAMMGSPAADAATTDTAVGIPQSRNTSPMRAPRQSPAAAALIASTAEKLVPPSPPTSIAAKPSAPNSFATRLEMPAPVSLATPAPPPG